MNMFSSKEQVDKYVRKLLNSTNSGYDNDMQAQQIAKFYFDVKEYQIAQHYINKFIQIQANSKPGLKLQAKIHENLQEFEAAAKSYERLFELHAEQDDLLKVCECLSKCENVPEKKLMKYLELLERLCPTSEFYMKLRSKTSSDISFPYNRVEIDNLKNSMKSNVNDDLKIRFLRILENQQGIVDSIQECCTLIDNYSFLDNYDAVMICSSIFKKHFKPENKESKLYYCLVLISLMGNRKTICEFDLESCLLKLIDLLHDEHYDDIYKLIFRLFAYLMSSTVHNKLNRQKKLDHHIFESIVCGYLLSCTNQIDGNNLKNSSLFSWIREQLSLVKSVSSQVIKASACRPVNLSGCCLVELGKTIWQNSSNQEIIRKLSVINKKFPNLPIRGHLDPSDVNFNDMGKFYGDLKLIGWHINCLNDSTNQSKDDIFNNFLNSDICCFLIDLVKKLFSKIPLVPQINKRSPENISQTDIFVFLLMVAQKVINHQSIAPFAPEKSGAGLPVAYEQWSCEFRAGDYVNKWWSAAIDYTLQNRRKTSIGALKDLLRNGLDSLRSINSDKSMSEVIQLYMGRFLNDCAKYINDSSINASLVSRSIDFYSIVLLAESKFDNKYLFKNLPMGNIYQQSTVNRHNSSINFSASSSEQLIKEFFDIDQFPVANSQEMNEIKFDGCITVIDYLLEQSIIRSNDLDILLETAQKSINNSPSPLLNLRKSRIFEAKARQLESDSLAKPGEVDLLMRHAREKAREGIDLLKDSKNTEIYDLLQMQLNNVSDYNNPVIHQDYSVFELSCLNETSNNNRSAYNQTMSMFEANNGAITEQLNKFKSDITEIFLAQEKFKNLAQNMEKNLQANERKMEYDRNLHGQQVAQLNSKIDSLTSHLNNLDVQVEFNRSEIDNLKQCNKNLIDSISKLTVENAQLQLQNNDTQRAHEIQRKIINPSVRKINSLIENQYQDLYDDLNKQINALGRHNPQEVDDEQEEDSDQSSDESDSSSDESDESEQSDETSVDRSESSIDLSKFSRGKWECPTCCCLNDDRDQSCPACQSNKPSINHPAVEVKPKPAPLISQTLDLSKFSQNKWECPTCACMNENGLSNCPACTTRNPAATNQSSGLPSSASNQKFTEIKFGTSTGTNNPTGGFTFGSTVANNNSTNILFGTKNNEINSTSNNLIGQKSSGIKFGSSVASSSSTDIFFGTKNTDNNVIGQKPSGFTFGQSVSTNSNSTFNLFGTKNVDDKSTKSAIDTNTTGQKPSGFTFSSAAASNSSTFNIFGTKKNDEKSEPPKIDNTVATKNTTGQNILGFTFSQPMSNMASNQEYLFSTKAPENNKNMSTLFDEKINDIKTVPSTIDNSTIENTESTINTESNWKCVCTTSNKPDRTQCIACDLKKNALKTSEPINNDDNDTDDCDVIIVSEPYVTEEQIARARTLLLPDHFYYYENLPESQCNRDSEDEDNSDNVPPVSAPVPTESPQESSETKPKPLFEFLPISANNQFTFSTVTNPVPTFSGFNFASNSQSSFVTISSKQDENDHVDAGEADGDHPENFDAQYQPIIDLPDKIDVVTGEENSVCLFSKRSKLFKFDEGSVWKERGLGDMKILQFEKDGKTSYRLLMRREQVHKICCNQSIFKTCPKFSDLDRTPNSACWFAQDFSEGTELDRVNFAIKFKQESDLKEFKEIIESIQNQLEL